MMIQRASGHQVSPDSRRGPLSGDYIVSRFAQGDALNALTAKLGQIGFLGENSSIRDTRSNTPGQKPLIRLVNRDDSWRKPLPVADISRHYRSQAPSLRYPLEVEFNDILTTTFKKGHVLFSLVPVEEDAVRIFAEADEGLRALEYFRHLAPGATASYPEMEFVYCSSQNPPQRIETLKAAIAQSLPLAVTLAKPELPGLSEALLQP
jgi:hypothetical protein